MRKMTRPGVIILSLVGLVFSLILTAWLEPGGLELRVTPVKGGKQLLDVLQSIIITQ